MVDPILDQPLISRSHIGPVPWSQLEIDYHPIYGQTLSRNRYKTILRCLYFYNPNTTEVSDNLHKINNVLAPIISNIQTKYYSRIDTWDFFL